MLIVDLRELIIDEGPCRDGLEWFDRVSRDHVNTTTFFQSLKNVEKTKHVNTPHGYLRWIFYNCLDWSKIMKAHDDLLCWHIAQNNQYSEFINKNFKVDSLLDLSIPKLCDALTRAFEDD